MPAPAAVPAGAPRFPTKPQPVSKKRRAAQRKSALPKLSTSTPDVSSSPTSRGTSALWWMNISVGPLANLAATPQAVPAAKLTEALDPGEVSETPWRTEGEGLPAFLLSASRAPKQQGSQRHSELKRGSERQRRREARTRKRFQKGKGTSSSYKCRGKRCSQDTGLGIGSYTIGMSALPIPSNMTLGKSLNLFQVHIYRPLKLE